MLFRRRNPDGLFERLRIFMWPRRSFSRSFQYVSKRILRLNASPHAVAAGVAAGVFASFFPLGSHFAIAAIVCWLIAGNMVAAGLGTFVFGNPLTLPFVVGASWEAGKIMLHGHMQSHERPVHLIASPKRIASILASVLLARSNTPRISAFLFLAAKTAATVACI